MSGTEIESKARELKELRRMKEELDAEITALEDAIKAEMTRRNVETLTVGEYRVRWTPYTASRFDTTRFKQDHASLAAAYTKITECRRFTIA